MRKRVHIVAVLLAAAVTADAQSTRGGAQCASGGPPVPRTSVEGRAVQLSISPQSRSALPSTKKVRPGRPCCCSASRSWLRWMRAAVHPARSIPTHCGSRMTSPSSTRSHWQVDLPTASKRRPPSRTLSRKRWSLPATGATSRWSPARLSSIWAGDDSMPSRRMSGSLALHWRPRAAAGFRLGARGAGRFAMQGGYLGDRQHSGQGAAFRQVGDVKVLVVTVVNAFGSIVDRNGRMLRCSHPVAGECGAIAVALSSHLARAH